VVDIDKFFINNEKVDMLGFSMYAISGKVLIINQILMSSLLYFISIWVGLEKVLQKIHVLLRNYLRIRNEHVARSRVKWKDCYVKKKGGEWYLTHRKH
jgi:hypothetical protein